MLYKDISAHVALVTICRDRVDIRNVIYKPVHSMNPFHLKNPEDMPMFVLKATLF